jgi:hypothetical protein
MDVSGVTDHVDAVALAYCTDQPLRLTDVITGVEDLDEVVAKRRAGVSATAEDLADYDRGDESGVGVVKDSAMVWTVVSEWEWSRSWCCSASTSDTELLCTLSADTTSVDVPAPRNSAGTRT